MFKFADSTNPSAINESQFSHVAAYGNGLYTWPDSQVKRFPKHFLISTESGNPGAAKHMRCLDTERYDASALDVPPFVDTRMAFGHDDSLIYTSILGNGPNEGIAPIVRVMADQPGVWALWVAWWWGRPFAPTISEVLAEVKALTGIELPAYRVRACQWRNGPDIDESVWYDRDTFTSGGLALPTTAEVAETAEG